MIDPVLINFAVGGMREVDRAFDTLDKRMARFERDTGKSVSSGSASRVRATETETQRREKAYAKLVRDIEKDERAATKAAETQARARDLLHRRSSEVAGRYAHKAAEDEVKAAKATVKEIERLEAYKMRVRIRSSEQAGRIAAREASTEAATRKKIAHATGGILSRGVGNAAGGAASAVGMAASIGGGLLLGNVIAGKFAAQKQAALLVNAVTATGTPPAGANVNAITSQANQLSMQTGMSAEDLISGTLAYARSAKGGDFKGAMANMGFLGRMSQVTGTDIGTLGSAAGMLQSQNPKLGAPEMQQTLLDMYAQSKAGSLSMPELAKMAGTIGSVRGSFAGDATTNQRMLMSMAQLVTPETNPEEAGTMVKDFALQLGERRHDTGKKKGFQSMGVKYNKQGQMESVEQAVDAILSYSKGDVTSPAITEMGVRGATLLRHLTPIYNQAGGGAAGLAAVHGELSSVQGATMSGADMNAQFAQTMSTSAARIDLAFTKIKDTLSDRLGPVLDRIADKAPEIADTFGKIADAGADLAEWFIDNPYKGAGALIGLSLTKELAAAGIPKLLEAALTTKLGGGIALVGASIAITEAGMMVIDQLAQMDVMSQKANVAQDVGALNTAGQLKHERETGTLTPGDVSAAQQQAAQLEARLNKPSWGELALDSVSLKPLREPLGLTTFREDQNARERKDAADNLKTLNKEIRAAASALKAFGDAARSESISGRTGKGAH